ncbi:MAG: hypothetical protein K6E95_06740 [Lachnospiraceae bacterium]|nr:hypothetical protein [Lachnospiraceae bacterium]
MALKLLTYKVFYIPYLKRYNNLCMMSVEFRRGQCRKCSIKQNGFESGERLTDI